MQSERSERRAGAKRRKTALACEPCRQRKSRCDGDKPMCASCVRRGLPISQCIYKTENSRSSCSDDYLQALHQRIRELEGNAATAGPANVLATNNVVPVSVSERFSGTDGEAVDSDGQALSPSEIHDTLRPSITQPVDNTTVDPFYGHNRRSSFNSASNVTGMGAMASVDDNERFSSRSAQYFGSSSTASLMCLLTRDKEQQISPTPLPQDCNTHPQRRAVDTQPCRPDTPFRRCDDFVLPPRDFADHLLNCFWDRIYCIYPFFDRPTFQEAYENIWAPTSRPLHQVTELNVGLGDRVNSGPESIVFNCALNTMFALGCHLTESPIPDRETLVTQFFLRAKHHIGLDMLDIQSIGVVQTLLIVALFLQSTPYPHRCWNSIGTACRLALALGLHDVQLEKLKGQLELEIHRRTWHGCVMMDMTVSMTYGRPSMTTHLESVPLPGILDLETRQETEGPSLVSFYLSTIELYSILDLILSDVYKAWRGRSKELTQEAKQPGLDLVIQIEDQLLKYQASVPPHLNWTVPYVHMPEPPNHSTLQRQRNVLHLRFLHLQILLYRPIFTQLCFEAQPDERLYSHPDSLHSSMLTKCASGCIKSAFNLISLVHDTYKTSKADTWWYNGFYTSTAAMVLIMSYKCRVPLKFKDVSIDLTWQKAEAILQDMVSFSTSARNTLGFLRTIRAQLVSTLDLAANPQPNNNHASREPILGQVGTETPALFNTQPFSFDGAYIADELGFLGSFEFQEIQDWLPQAG